MLDLLTCHLSQTTEKKRAASFTSAARAVRLFVWYQRHWHVSWVQLDVDTSPLGIRYYSWLPNQLPNSNQIVIDLNQLY